MGGNHVVMVFALLVLFALLIWLMPWERSTGGATWRERRSARRRLSRQLTDGEIPPEEREDARRTLAGERDR